MGWLAAMARLRQVRDTYNTDSRRAPFAIGSIGAAFGLVGRALRNFNRRSRGAGFLQSGRLDHRYRRRHFLGVLEL